MHRCPLDVGISGYAFFCNSDRGALQGTVGLSTYFPTPKAVVDHIILLIVDRSFALSPHRIQFCKPATIDTVTVPLYLFCHVLLTSVLELSAQQLRVLMLLATPAPPAPPNMTYDSSFMQAA